MNMEGTKVIFFNDSHTYWHGERKLNSVGKAMSLFKPPYPREYWLTNAALKELFGDEYVLAYRKLKDRWGMKPPAGLLFGPFISKIGISELEKCRAKYRDIWLLKNNEANFRGSQFHDEREAEAYARGYAINPWDEKKYKVTRYEKEYPNESLSLDLHSLPDGCYPELLLFNLELGIAGQADQVFIETKRKYRYIDINDFKTNNKGTLLQSIPRTSPDRMYDPFSHLPNSKHMGYAFQISMYAKLMELAGYRVRNLAYTWYKDYDVEQSQLVDIQYLSKEVDKIFSIFSPQTPTI